MELVQRERDPRGREQERESGVAGEFFLVSLWSVVLPSELCEPLGLARETCARMRCGSRARKGRRASQRRRGRAASESMGAEEARAAGTRGNQRTSREVATPLFLFIWELNVSGV